MRGWTILAMGLICAGCGQVADAQGQLVETLRVKSAIADYEKAATPLDRCIKAKLVAAAYTDAKDPAETAAWQAREKEDCRLARAAVQLAPLAGGPKPRNP